MTITKILEDLITREGVLSSKKVMEIALCHRDFGYYTQRNPIGAEGDFTTAPEISQMFGELCGLWAVDLWMQLGSPKPFVFSELGPGRGTLMQDALRVASRVCPDFIAAQRLHLLDINEPLIKMQAEKLHIYTPIWHHTSDDFFSTIKDMPLILIANEFFDALPIHQFIATNQGFRELAVDFNGQSFVETTRPTDLTFPPHAPGDVLEVCPQATEIMTHLAQRLTQNPGGALIIDYGYWDAPKTSTLQALRAHKMENYLENLGLADITAHVDFAALAACLAGAPVDVQFTTQGDFLKSLGIEKRAQTLKAAGAATIEADLERLIHPAQMGNLFKVLAVRTR